MICLQTALLPSPTNLSALYVTADQALSCLAVQQWVARQLPELGALPLLEGCYVLVPAQVGAKQPLQHHRDAGCWLGGAWADGGRCLMWFW